MDGQAFDRLTTQDGKEYWLIPAELAAKLVQAAKPDSQQGLPILRASEPEVDATPADREEARQETLGQRIKRLRVAKGISQRELARRAEITHATLNKIENDKGKRGPQDLTLQAIMKQLES